MSRIEAGNEMPGRSDSTSGAIKPAFHPPNAKQPQVIHGETPDTAVNPAKEEEAAMYEASWRKSCLETLPGYDLKSQRNGDPPEYTEYEDKPKGVREKLMAAVKSKESEDARRQRKKEYKDLGLGNKVVFGMDGGPQSSI